MNILVTIPVNDTQKAKIEQAAPQAAFRYVLPQDMTAEILAWPEVILGNLADPGQVKDAEKLQWIQLNNAGTEGYCEMGLLAETVHLTNATGAYGLAISEHMMACLFALRKKLQLYYTNQLQGQWKKEGHVGVIEGMTVLSIGMGDIGRSFLKRMKALGCKTIGCKKTSGTKPEYVDELYTMEKLDEILPQADVVALSMPGNTETYHTMNADRIARLKSTAIVINVGRGPAIDTDALTKSLYEGLIGGAALDVTDPEPLPADHPLWKAPNTIITPHVSGGFALPETLEQIVEICAENLAAYVQGKPLKNEVDRVTGYAKQLSGKGALV